MLRFLICDDDRKTRVQLQHLLERSGPCEIIEVENVMDGLDVLARDRFDLLIVNLRLPELSGADMLRIIRETPELAGLGVVVVSAGNDEAQVREVMALGILDFLVTPLDPHHAQPRLLRAIARLPVVSAP